MIDPQCIDVSALSEPGELARLLTGPLPLVVTDHGEVLEVIEERTDGITAEELTAFWESGGGADPGMLTEIDALFTDGDSFSAGDSQ